MHDAAAHIAPGVGVGAADDQHVDRNPQIPQHPCQPNRLIGFIRDIRLDNEEVEMIVTARIAFAPAEYDYLRRPPRSCGQPAPRFFDHDLIDHADTVSGRSALRFAPVPSKA